MTGSTARLLCLLGILICSGGASCRPWGRPADPLVPVAFGGPPTLNDVTYTLNTNSARIQQLSTESAKLTMSGEPIGLKASLNIDRPRRIRLKGRLIGQELDIGSNDELLWFWAKRDPEQAVYYAYHEQFQQVGSNAILPISPDWLVEALGLVTLDPSQPHDGPYPRPDGSLEVRTRLERQGRALTRVLIIDGKYGHVTEQQLFDLAGKPLAVARCASFRFYEEAGTSLPHRVQVELPPAQLAFQIEVDQYTVNQLLSDPVRLFEFPHYEGYRLVNLAQPAAQPVSTPTTPPSIYAPTGNAGPSAPQPYGQPAHTAYRLRYRGFQEPR